MAQAVQAQPATFLVAVPAGAGPGTMLALAAPNGVQVQVQVPAGMNPGQQFSVAMPQAAPVMQAQYQQPTQVLNDAQQNAGGALGLGLGMVQTQSAAPSSQFGIGAFERVRVELEFVRCLTPPRRRPEQDSGRRSRSSAISSTWAASSPSAWVWMCRTSTLFASGTPPERRRMECCTASTSSEQSGRTSLPSSSDATTFACSQASSRAWRASTAAGCPAASSTCST